MDKKTEIAIRTGKRLTPEAASAPPTAAAPPAAAPPSTAPQSAAPLDTAQSPAGWWMYHGDPGHTGYVSDSSINSQSFGSPADPTTPDSAAFGVLHSLQLEGPVLSVPAVANGSVYVGLANYHLAQGGNGGALHRIDIESGQIAATYAWDLGDQPRDIHSFTGMGCTPAVAYGRVFFGAFDGRLYCLDDQTLGLIWVTDLRNADPAHNQPVTNTLAVDQGNPAAVIWSSPVLSADGTKLYVGCGEGENPYLFSFVFCLDTATGNVNWIYCTNQFVYGQNNPPNLLPAMAVGPWPPSPPDSPPAPLPPPYSVSEVGPIVRGCSVWGAIAYDAELNRIYCSTGNQAPETNNSWDWPGYEGPVPPFLPELPSPGYSNGILALDAATGEFQAFFQVPPDSNYRPSDVDVDVGGGPVVFQWEGGAGGPRKAVCFACKNGSVFILDAESLSLLAQRQLLPYHADGSRIETVDPHPTPSDPNINPQIPNYISDVVANENYSGTFNTPAVRPGDATMPQMVFVPLGGPNYHNQAPGIDHENTPFMRALDAATLKDAWPVEGDDPPRYSKVKISDPNFDTQVGMYSFAGESALSSPAVVNDVVFCTTSKISIYAFDVRDGTLLWYDNLGSQTDGYNGGYGYCLGPAVWQDYVVAGALVFGLEGGGILNIYGPLPQSPPDSPPSSPPSSPPAG